MLTNQTRQRTLASNPRLADTFWWRTRGMIGRRFDAFDALVFDRCSSIHMMWMNIPLDIVFVDRAGTIHKLYRQLKPWRFAFAPGARLVIELPVGAIEAADCQLGDQLLFPPALALDLPSTCQ